MPAARRAPARSRRDRTPRVAVVASRYNENVTRRLLVGAETCLRERGIGAGETDVVWVAGAWELPVVVRALVRRRRYVAAVALGAVIRGETAHFEIIAAESARGLMSVAVETGVPVGFGVLTCDTLDQALARAGGAAGNKGYDAAAAALDAAAVLRARDGHPG
jgi:6,7-dimethyl-8-ribityllumazine synthase